ncbi:MAG: hypothetical protein FJ404_04200 [Verrucomicrobia bacterium]|nr:hypothetical protein [Verrucomicrobiota bacterium]
MKRKADALTIACQALWELLRRNSDLSDDLLIRTMEEIDLRDGKQDGKITRRPVPCPKCRRNSQSGRSHCLYCGELLPVVHVFEKI